MDADVVERAFEPFFTTKGIGKGTGLGLSMVYGVAHQSGGTARIESRPGEGTTVTIVLRRAAFASPQAEERQVPRPSAAEERKGHTILVVDDDPDVRMIIAGAIELMGYDVVQAEDGPSALERLGREAPALVIVDFAMPGMNGAEVAAEARRLHPNLPILFASGFADTDALTRAVGTEMPLIRKPFQISELSAAVAAALKRQA